MRNKFSQAVPNGHLKACQNNFVELSRSVENGVLGFCARGGKPSLNDIKVTEKYSMR